MAVGTMQGTTVAFGTSSLSVKIVGLTPPGATRAAVATTYLGTTGGKTFQPSELYEMSEIVLRIQADYTVLEILAPIVAAAEVITITYPDTTAQVVTGFCVSVSPAEISAGADNLAEATLTWKPVAGVPT